MGAGTTLCGHDCKSFNVQCGEKQTGRESIWGIAEGTLLLPHLKNDEIERNGNFNYGAKKGFLLIKSQVILFLWIAMD